MVCATIGLKENVQSCLVDDSTRRQPRGRDGHLAHPTIQSAEGPEWRNVFVLNAVDGGMPSDLGTGSHAESEEERRLLYVAMTRAKDELHVLVPQRFYVKEQARHGDRCVLAARTRFIPSDILDRLERRTAGAARGADDRRKAMVAPVDIAAGARAVAGLSA